jgi:hypothetical protein
MTKYLSLFLTGFSLTLSSCDSLPLFRHDPCSSKISHAVQIGQEIDISTDDPLLIAYVEKKSSSETPPLDAKGIPIGDTLVLYANVKSLKIEKEVRSYSHEIESIYSNWAFAFIDKNKDGILNIGEPFGVNKSNPAEAKCHPYNGVIEINSIY